MITFLLSALFVGTFFLIILWSKQIFLYKHIMRLIQEKDPELHKKLLKPKQFESLGVPNTFLGFPIWPGDSWRQTKFFLSSRCISSNEEICRMRERARKLMFAYFIVWGLWMIFFFGVFLFFFDKNNLQWI